MRARFVATAMLCIAAPAAHAESTAVPVPSVASYYGSESGRHTASGERFDPKAMTAACCGPGYRDLPFGARILVCRTDTGADASAPTSASGQSRPARIDTETRRCVGVRVNDRGPFVRGRYLDLSEGAARRIGLLAAGVGAVQIEVLSRPDYAPEKGDWGFF